MNNTNADDVIIQALCPGPDVVDSVGDFGWLLVTYASTSARRAASSAAVGPGAAGAAGAAAGAAGAAAAGAAAAGAAAAGAAGGSSAEEGRVVITNSAAEMARKNAMRGMVFVMSSPFGSVCDRGPRYAVLVSSLFPP